MPKTSVLVFRWTVLRVDNGLFLLNKRGFFRDYFHLVKGGNDVLARHIGSVFWQLIAKEPRTMLQRVCVDQSPLLPDVFFLSATRYSISTADCQLSTCFTSPSSASFSSTIAHPQTSHISSPSPSSQTPLSSSPAPASSSPSISTTSSPYALQSLRSCQKSSC